jgi:hypothetical protein
MKDIIKDAHEKRYVVPEDDPNKQGIVISDKWMTEL